MTDVKQIAELFSCVGRVVSTRPFGNGHINGTWLVETDAPHRYVLQRINTGIFKDPDGLMKNMLAVIDWLKKKDDDPRHVLTPIPLQSGAMWLTTDDGECWRMVEYIENSICLEMPESEQDLTLIGEAFGHFQCMLADFPAESLTETIPRFHHTPTRYAQLKEAIRLNKAGRVSEVGPEIDFFLAREKDASLVTDLLEAGKLPLRVTHNDTKINNIMLDRESRLPLCVLDLDTVMPGLVGNDFGEAVRYGASTAAEDERDLSRVSMSLDLFGAYAKGFLKACGKDLTEEEIRTLPDCARLMTLENGTRFLADYLNGDVYFATQRPGQNLDRARTQMTLVADMETKRDRMAEIIRETVAKL